MSLGAIKWYTALYICSRNEKWMESAILILCHTYFLNITLYFFNHCLQCCLASPYQYRPSPVLNWDVFILISQIYKSLIEYEKWSMGGSGEINVMDHRGQSKPPTCVCVCMYVCMCALGLLQHYWTSEWVMIVSQTGQLPLALIY